MTHYSNNPANVQVNFWKVRENGGMKWGYTESMKWTGGYADVDIATAFKFALAEQFGGRFGGLLAVCNEPYHEHAHPIAVQIPEGGC